MSALFKRSPSCTTRPTFDKLQNMRFATEVFGYAKDKKKASGRIGQNHWLRYSNILYALAHGD